MPKNNSFQRKQQRRQVALTNFKIKSGEGWDSDIYEKYVSRKQQEQQSLKAKLGV